MPAKRTPTPEEMFGFGAVPLTSYFGLPEGGSQNTMFSPEARSMMQQGEQYQRQQQAQEAEDVANEMLGQAGGMSDEQINQHLLQNPRLLSTQGGQQAQQFQRFRQEVAPSQADEVLGPIYAAKIKDPRLLERFESRMVDQGMSANDAFEEYRRDEYNDKYASDLAELGVPDSEIEQLKTPKGYIDPVLASRRKSMALAQAKEAERLNRPDRTSSPIDQEMSFLEKQLSAAAKANEATPDALAQDPAYQRRLNRYNQLVTAKEAEFNPPVAPVLGAAVKLPTTPATGAETAQKAVAPIAPVFDVNLPPEENQARLKQYKKDTEKQVEEQKVADSIAKAWTGKKIELIDKLEPFYKSPDEMRAVANSILLGKTIDVQGKRKPYIEYLAEKLGIKLKDVAFEEPESQSWNRFGTQEVTNAELLTDWAKSFQEADKKLQEANATNTQVTGGQVPANNGRIVIGAPTKTGGP